MIEFGRDICSDSLLSSKKEWLVTNGIGGFASGTISGVLTRRYHGLLIAALQPPLGRTLLVTKIEETAEYCGQAFPLYSDRWADGSVRPTGNHLIERFYLDHSMPTWEYAVADAIIEKRIWMTPEENTTCVRYALLRPGVFPLRLGLRILVNQRDYHSITHANLSQTLKFQVFSADGGLQIQGDQAVTTCYLRSSETSIERVNEWQYSYYLSAEAARGESTVEDHLVAGKTSFELHPDRPVTITMSSDGSTRFDSETSFRLYQDHETEILSKASRSFLVPPSVKQSVEQLLLAADQFIVRRPTANDPQGKTILAGYPWFSDWGRDTMISLPGLTLAVGRPEIARSILRTFAAYVDQGMLPNRFPDQGETPEYNTVDAALWFFEAVRAYLASTNDQGFIDELYPALQEIIRWHLKGTRFHIQCDLDDGLLFAGEQDSQLTWMDVRINGWAVTPRSGKPVEINALWYNALTSMVEFSKVVGRPGAEYHQAAQKAHLGFQRFWNPNKNYCFDVLDGPRGNDSSLRPNQLFAVSLHHSPLTGIQQRAVVDCCARHLLTSFGLRSLSQSESQYIGHYGGDRWQRDTAYHQGTVWAWLIGTLVSAHLRVYANPDLAWSLLHPLLIHLSDHGLGSISEIFDGDPPFKPEGCPAQAWSVAEVLRSIQQIQHFTGHSPG